VVEGVWMGGVPGWRTCPRRSMRSSACGGWAPVDAATYVLDADGNRTRLTTPDGAEEYTLNAIDQLTSVSYLGGKTTTYGYDAAGNRATSKTGSAPEVAYTYDAASQLTSVDVHPSRTTQPATSPLPRARATNGTGSAG
jgi:YD repeat-containing protein